MKLLNDLEKRKRLAKLLVLNCFRNNTILENIHCGLVPYSKNDNKDVYVISENCPNEFKDHKKIKWDNLSRINDKEMKILMIEVVNNVFTFLSNLTNKEFSDRINEILDKQDPIEYWYEPKYIRLNPIYKEKTKN